MIEWNDAQRRCAIHMLAKWLSDHPDAPKPDRIDVSNRIVALATDSKQYLISHDYVILNGKSHGSPRLVRQPNGSWEITPIKGYIHT